MRFFCLNLCCEGLSYLVSSYQSIFLGILAAYQRVYFLHFIDLFSGVFVPDDVCQLSVLLLDMMEALHSPLCSPWATHHVCLYVIRHYIAALKKIVDQTVSLFCFLSFGFSNPCYRQTVFL